jgi:hypothetical protein
LRRSTQERFAARGGGPQSYGQLVRIRFLSEPNPKPELTGRGSLLCVFVIESQVASGVGAQTNMHIAAQEQIVKVN